MSDPSHPATIDAMLKPGERPTLKTISRITGLAVATVSRALNDAPDIGAKTKQRVNECAEQIGYRPNRAGVRLRTGKTHVISLVMSTEHDLMNHTARLITSVAGALRGTPYHLIVTPYFPDQDPMVPVRYVVETRSADAVILNQIEPRDARVDYLIKQKFPFATHGRTNLPDAHAFFDFDNEEFLRLATHALADRGRRNLLLIAPPLHQNYAQHMVTGLRTTAAQRGITATVLEGASSDSPSAQIERAVTQALTTSPQIDGVVSGSVVAAMVAAGTIETVGRTIGGDIDLFAKEAIPFLTRFRKNLLTVDEDVAGAGAFLARAVLQQITDPTQPPMQGLDIPSYTAPDTAG